MQFDFDTSFIPPELMPYILPVSILLTGITLSLWIAYVGSLWLVYSKAGRLGCLIFVPIVNVYTMLRIAGHPAWHFLLFFIPLVNIIIAIMMWINLGKAFGKGTLFGLGLIFFHWIFVVWLAFGRSEYLLHDPRKQKTGEFQPMNVRPT